MSTKLELIPKLDEDRLKNHAPALLHALDLMMDATKHLPLSYTAKAFRRKYDVEAFQAAFEEAMDVYEATTGKRKIFGG